MRCAGTGSRADTSGTWSRRDPAADEAGLQSHPTSCSSGLRGFLCGLLPKRVLFEQLAVVALVAHRRPVVSGFNRDAAVTSFAQESVARLRPRETFER